MLLFWRIRYFDTRDKEFKNRDLELDTETLDPVTKAAVEATRALSDPVLGREMLRYRHLFVEEKEYSGQEREDLMKRHGGMESFCLPGYFEDEDGKERTLTAISQVLTGDPNAVVFPHGAKQHDIDFMLAAKPNIDLAQIHLSAVDLNTLAYFSRSLRQMQASCFVSEGPGKIIGVAGRALEFQTAVSEDELRSFVIVFRQLYMAKDPGNFAKATEAFARAVLPHPLGAWVQGVEKEYEHDLASVPDLIPFASNGGATFTRKRLIDVFLYTQFVHQGEEQRERQYAECLAQVGQQQGLLLWLFLKSIWECALQICSAGVQIASFTEQYCKYRNLTPSVVQPATKSVGMGELEKRSDRETRVLKEKAEELAEELWKISGNPQGGSARFMDEARRQLRAAMLGKPDVRKTDSGEREANAL